MFGYGKDAFLLPDERIASSKEWNLLLEKTGFDPYGIYRFENDVFRILPYYWGGCTCGFSTLDARWFEEHKHKDDCFLELVEKELIAKGWMSLKLSFEEKDKLRENIIEKYCRQFGLHPLEDGLLHCTCGYEKDYHEWRKKNDHLPDCKLAFPNFLYKPTEFKIRWDKCPFKDSYMNQNIKTEEILCIFKKCAESI